MARKGSFPVRWAALPESIAEWRTAFAAGRSMYDDADHEAAMQALANPAVSQATGVAVVEITGALTKRAGWFSPVGMQDIGDALERIAARPDVGAIVLAIDSPGGTVDGTKALGDTIAAINNTKPVVAFADGCMCSAAYWLGSQTSWITASPLSHVGSIGTLLVHADYSVMLEEAGIKVTVLRADASTEKAKGNPYEPLDEGAKAKYVAQLNRANDTFIAAVKAGRSQDIPATAFNGDAWMAEDVPAGIVDDIGTLQDAIAKAAELAAERSQQSRELTRADKDMTEVIQSVRAAFAGKEFLSDALGMAADGKSEAAIWQAYATQQDARIEAMGGEHSKAIDDIKAEHKTALEAKDTEHAKALKEANDRADQAEAKLKAAGWSAAEGDDGDSKSKGGITITKLS